MADGASESFLLRECRLADLWLVCSKLRDSDIEEFIAESGATEWDHETLTIMLMNKIGPSYCLAFNNGDPIACGGFCEITPGNWDAWLAGTKLGWDRHYLSITKCAISVFSQMFENGARRIQTKTINTRKSAIFWYQKMLHMRNEGTFFGYGANGEDFLQFAVLKQEWIDERRR